MREHSNRIIILSGESGCGKSMLCQLLLERLHGSGLDIRGVIMPPVLEQGEKTGIDLLDLQSGKTKRAASLRKSEGSGLFTNKWQFDREVMDWGNSVLEKSVPCDLLIIDELGPLEFERGEGWQNGLSVVDGRTYSTALVIVRPSLVEIALKRWEHAVVLTMTRASQGEVLENILGIIESQK